MPGGRLARTDYVDTATTARRSSDHRVVTGEAGRSLQSSRGHDWRVRDWEDRSENVDGSEDAPSHGTGGRGFPRRYGRGRAGRKATRRAQAIAPLDADIARFR